MRVLFCSTGGAGHLLPMHPLASALQRLGHAVGWITAPDALSDLSGQGFALFPAGQSFEVSRHQFRRSHPDIEKLQGEEISQRTFPSLFGATLAPAMLNDIGRAVDLWQPDFMVLEPGALAAPLACQLRQLPYVTHGFGLPLPPTHLRESMRWFRAHWAIQGLEAPADGGLYRHLYIDIAPASLSAGIGQPDVTTLALNPYARTLTGTSQPPADLREPLMSTRRPRVYLTFGTVFNRQPAFAEAAKALVDLGAEVIVTIGRDGDLSQWMHWSPHLHARRFVDQAILLPFCDAVVSHGGAGTVLAAAAHGLPQLVLPQAADQFRNARALVAVSAGIALEPSQQIAASIRSHAARLLASPSHAAGAERLAEEMDLMPMVSCVARALQSIAPMLQKRLAAVRL